MGIMERMTRIAEDSGVLGTIPEDHQQAETADRNFEDHEEAHTSDLSHEDGSIATVESQLKDIAKKARQAHKRIQRAAQAAIEAVVSLGEQLSTAKDLLAGHKGGSYGKWLKSIGVPRSSASRAVQVWERLGACPNVAQLPLSAAYSLASPSTPQQAVDQVLEAAASGPVETRVIREIITKHKPRRNPNAGAAPIVITTASGSVAIKPSEKGVTAEVLLVEALQFVRNSAAA